MRRLRSRALTVVVALLAWSVAALLPLLHVHGGPPDTGRLTLVHLPGDGHVHVAVRDYGHADTWDERGVGTSGVPHPVDHEHQSDHECPACLAATVVAGAVLPPTGGLRINPDPIPVRFALPGPGARVRAASPSPFHARAPPSV